MHPTSALDRLKSRFEFVAEEPGYLAVVILIATFIALTPKVGCSFHEAEAPVHAPAAGSH